MEKIRVLSIWNILIIAALPCFYHINRYFLRKTKEIPKFS
jgi:hypothetical protein